MRTGECDGGTLAALAAGQVVVVLGSGPGRDEAVLVLAAEHADTATVAFTVRHSSGLLCVAMTADRASRLEIPAMTATAGRPPRAAFTVSVDARPGSGPGSPRRTAHAPSGCWPRRTPHPPT
ncbi:hypothetical protein BJF78_23755 [Pseudonocardia sp. CNS-139]|nr:hypothetical protein BJF78_23755 [Pseudonocardia sp. CNS-139]